MRNSNRKASEHGMDHVLNIYEIQGYTRKEPIVFRVRTVR